MKRGKENLRDGVEGKGGGLKGAEELCESESGGGRPGLPGPNEESARSLWT